MRRLAHLTITLLRVLAVPARLVAGYALGLSLVRICCGRDAADTAFLTLSAAPPSGI